MVDYSKFKNKENEGKKRPVCSCGIEMIYIAYQGYYDDRSYWLCGNPICQIEDDFKPDAKSLGSHAADNYPDLPRVFD